MPLTLVKAGTICLEPTTLNTAPFDSYRASWTREQQSSSQIELHSAFSWEEGDYCQQSSLEIVALRGINRWSREFWNCGSCDGLGDCVGRDASIGICREALTRYNLFTPELRIRSWSQEHPFFHHFLILSTPLQLRLPEHGTWHPGFPRELVIRFHSVNSLNLQSRSNELHSRCLPNFTFPC